MNNENVASQYSMGPVARMVLLVVGFGYIVVGGCWFWVFHAYPALSLVAFGLVPLAAVRWHSRPLIRAFLIGCCLSVSYLALALTRAMFRQYKGSIHPLFWAFPVFATLLPLALWVLVKWLDQPPAVSKSLRAFPLHNLAGNAPATWTGSSMPIPTSEAAPEPETHPPAVNEFPASHRGG